MSTQTGYERLAEALRDSQFHDLDPDTKSKVLVEYVRADHEMKHGGQKTPIWDGSVPMEDVIGHEVVAKTERGEMVGKAIWMTTMPDSDGVYKHGVVIHVPSSGSVLMVPGRNVKLANDEDRQRMTTEIGFAKKLVSSNAAVEEIVIEKRARRVSGSHLYVPMMDEVSKLKLVVEDKTGWHLIYGNKKGPRVYLAKKGGTAHLSNFTVDHPGVAKITEEEAKARHLGKVRGEIDFDRDDTTIMAAWKAVLEVLG